MILKKFVRRVVRKFIVPFLDRPQQNNTLPAFATSPANSQIMPPFRISNPDRIFLGENVGLGPGAILEAQAQYPRGWMRHPGGDHVEQTFESSIRIGNRVTSTASLQVVAFREIIIEDDVMFASNVFICDGMHGYDRADVPYKYQGISQIAPIRIRNGCWIGQNVVLLPGVEIGERSIIGANSVVTSNIPPHSIAVGSPAKVIKRWNKQTGLWESL